MTPQGGRRQTSYGVPGVQSLARLVVAVTATTQGSKVFMVFRRAATITATA